MTNSRRILCNVILISWEKPWNKVANSGGQGKSIEGIGRVQLDDESELSRETYLQKMACLGMPG